MKNNYYSCIGLMSGTSLDGIDIVHIQMNKSNYKDFEIAQTETISYSKLWRNKLQTAITFSKEELLKLDVDYGKFLGDKLNNFIKKYKIEDLDFIASHGHTVLHDPNNGITLQVGNGQEIVNKTKTKVICDFRTQDVQLGGQGAPLVPIGDKLLFPHYSHCLNLGGFANISFEQNNQRIAFDVCPVNIVLNHYVNKLGLPFDDKGEIARKGNLNADLLEELNDLVFYKKSHPKSLGLEWVKEKIFPLLDKYKISEEDILRTFVEHAAIQLGIVLNKSTSILVTGGGVFNVFLIERIEYYSKKEIKTSSNKLIEYKEALIFAFLGVLKSENKINCLQSVTGASKDHSSGKIYLIEN